MLSILLSIDKIKSNQIKFWNEVWDEFKDVAQKPCIHQGKASSASLRSTLSALQRCFFLIVFWSSDLFTVTSDGDMMKWWNDRHRFHCLSVIKKWYWYDLIWYDRIWYDNIIFIITFIIYIIILIRLILTILYDMWYDYIIIWIIWLLYDMNMNMMIYVIW